MRTIKVRAADHRVPMPRSIRSGSNGRPFVLEPGEEIDVPDSRFIRGRLRAGDLVAATPAAQTSAPRNTRAPLMPNAAAPKDKE